MSHLPGGISAKYGNRYENRYLAKLLLRLVNEQITSIVVEPLEEGSNGVEFITTSADGTKSYYQCKVSNKTNNHWNMSDLQQHSVFMYSKSHVEKSEKNYYYFISPLTYSELDELCNRARTSSKLEGFSTYQLTNLKIRSTFDDCSKYYGLDKNSVEELAQLVKILSHCYFEVSPDGVEAERDLDEHVGMAFTGYAPTARLLLEQYANDTGIFGKSITANDIVEYMDDHDIHVRDYHHDERVISRIHTINDIYWDKYQPIGGRLFHREATDKIVEYFEAGHSIILHGKAGAGKSGCIQEIINYLKNKGILYLSIKLDKHVPVVSADEYGKRLGLPQSPVFCLKSLAANKPSVLILDQLDSLRWTCAHSAKALDICKELIAQVSACNKYECSKISIIIVLRTFDLEYDKGLRALLATENRDLSLKWVSCSLEILTNAEVQKIIGAEYEQLSLRLKDLLRTPSSLFVWTRLDRKEQKNSITSVYQLMFAWWSQILEGCAQASILKSDILHCTNSISLKMNTDSISFLPTMLFASYQESIDYLVSAGMLIKNTSNISFTHQSFFDYFTVTDSLEKIYSGKTLLEIIGDKDMQTPILRYRLLTILQSLIDSDEKMFLNQSERILRSDDVRYYFKCTIFEIIGQLEDPSKNILSLVETYLRIPEWNDFIIQAVYFGHAPFVMSMDKFRKNLWKDDNGLRLLKSVNHKVPDFVTDLLRELCFIDEETNRKVFWTMCNNPNDDSDKMFDLRIQLLKQTPKLFDDFWGLPTLFDQLSVRAIALMKLILQKCDTFNFSHVYFGEANQIDKYVDRNCSAIMAELFPIICEKTISLHPQLATNDFSDNYRKWVEYEYNDSPIRAIVNLVKSAFVVRAYNNPAELVEYLENMKNLPSVVGHEIVMEALENLPESYSNWVLRWLLEDFQSKVFVYTRDESDYLSCSKRIIKKFSPACTITLFFELEHLIYAWKDDSVRMKNIYQLRIKTNKERLWKPVYYAYWGHFQKELLPFMATARLSKRAKELLEVLNRNPWIRSPFYNCGFSGGSARQVTSPVNGYADKLSDKTWLKIISKPNEQMGNHWSGKEYDSYYLESSHSSFSSSFSSQAQKQPTRFAILSLRFREDCYYGYITSVISALKGKNENGHLPDMSLTCDVIRRFKEHENQNVAIEIARLIEARADEIWPEDTLDLLENIALRHPNPSASEYTVTSSEDPQNMSPNSLLTNSINCARGCALNAIAEIIWKHTDMAEKFRGTIIRAVTDENDAVRYSLMPWVLAFYNIDKGFSTDIFNKLLSLDLRILAAPHAYEILNRDYKNNREIYKSVLITACSSEINELASCVSGYVCAIAIFLKDQELLDFIMGSHFTTEQEDKICIQAASSFNLDEYHVLSETILRHFIDSSTNELNGINHLFFDRRIVIKRDADFLLHLMKSKQNVRQLHAFIDYLNESSEDITMFADILRVIGKNISVAPIEWNSSLVVSDLIKCVIHLFDRGIGNEAIRTACLDIWDDLFRSNLQDIKPLSDMLDNPE